MIVNIVNKYGLMPKVCFPESYSCESSGAVNQILRSKVCKYCNCVTIHVQQYQFVYLLIILQLREYTKAIRELIASGASDADVQTLIEQQMSTIFRIVGICLGIPDETFRWTYYDKNKAFHCVGPITPKQFYEDHVKPLFNVDDKVSMPLLLLTIFNLVVIQS